MKTATELKTQILNKAAEDSDFRASLIAARRQPSRLKLTWWDPND